MRRRDLSSVEAVGRVQTLDGSALVLKVLRDAASGWAASPVSRLTQDTLDVLREDGVRIVRLRRHRHLAEVSLAWFPVPRATRAEAQPVQQGSEARHSVC